MKDPMICNAVAGVNVPCWLIKTAWENAQLFSDSHPNVMNGMSANNLYEEFINYQTINHNNISQEAWEEAKVSDGVKKDVNDVSNSYH